MVDAANVVGSVPDGWWRDRLGAANRLVRRVGSLATAGVSDERLGTGIRHPEWIVVVEGKAARAQPVDGVRVVSASGSGDDAIVEVATGERSRDAQVWVVTSDRGLRARLADVDVAAVGTRWLTSRLPVA
ncbi:MAG: hypothetical protein ACK5MT_02515 [Actinomycetales bacterium]